MDWHIGQRVVCVRNNFKGILPCQIAGDGLPQTGKMYTIRGFNVWSPENDIVGTGCGFFLEEVINPLCHYADGVWREMSFDQCAFRPVKETSIAIFTAMLNPVLTKEPVR